MNRPSKRRPTFVLRQHIPAFVDGPTPKVARGTMEQLYVVPWVRKFTEMSGFKGWAVENGRHLVAVYDDGRWVAGYLTEEGGDNE